MCNSTVDWNSLNLGTLHGEPAVSQVVSPLAAHCLEVAPETGGTGRNEDSVMTRGLFPLSKSFLWTHPGRVSSGDFKPISLVPLWEFHLQGSLRIDRQRLKYEEIMKILENPNK